jgi:hypothetical protein
MLPYLIYSIPFNVIIFYSFDKTLSVIFARIVKLRHLERVSHKKGHYHANTTLIERLAILFTMLTCEYIVFSKGRKTYK